MATSVDSLVRKLSACSGELPEEKSLHFVKMRDVFAKAGRHLSGDVELRRESNVGLTRAIDGILDAGQVVEYITDSYSLKGPSSLARNSEIYSKMREFLCKDPCSEKVWPFGLGRIRGVIGQFTGPSFLDMLKNFSDQVCSRVESLIRQIDLEGAVGRSDFILVV